MENSNNTHTGEMPTATKKQEVLDFIKDLEIEEFTSILVLTSGETQRGHFCRGYDDDIALSLITEALMVPNLKKALKKAARFFQ